jgi:hypothetical protein
MRSSLRVLALLAIVVVLSAGGIFVAGGSWFREDVPTPRSPRLPDLVTLPLFDFLVASDELGNEALRFSTTIANVGDGPLLIRARRAFGWNDQWNVVQWFEEPDGQETGRLTGANMVFGGHGHEHWHIKFGAAYRLLSEDDRQLATQTKAGYCFFDQVAVDTDLPGAPAESVYPNDLCGKDGATSVEMGMSVGWSDPYFWQLEDQHVVISGFPDGRYRLTADADPDGWLAETDETNNGTWAIIELGTQADGLRTVELVESDEPPEIGTAP